MSSERYRGDRAPCGYMQDQSESLARWQAVAGGIAEDGLSGCSNITELLKKTRDGAEG